MFNSQSNPSDDYLCSYENGDLLAFWAPFLLVHLGGPDTITAFSVEDNQLWLRHLLAFITQAVATGYVFIKTLPRNRVMIPTTLLFIAGIIKYLERTSSLYFASKDKFRDSMLRNPDPGVNYAKLSEVLSEKPNEIRKKKYLNLKEKPSFKERDESRNFFNSISAEDAFKVIVGELNLFYEVLYTRVVIVHSKWGMFFRFISFCSVVDSIYYHSSWPFSQIDGDRLEEFTRPRERSPHWALNLFRISPQWALSLFGNFISLKKSKKVDLEPDKHTTLTAPLLFRMCLHASVVHNKLILEHGNDIVKDGIPVDVARVNYTKKVTRFSCIDKAIQCLNASKDRLIDLVGLKDFLDEITYVSSEPLTMELCEYIFGELQKRSRLIDDAETVRKICSATGDWVLQNNGLDKQRSDELISYVLAVPYDESILMWHIATELLINDKKERENKSNEKEFSKILSDYMLYLFIMQSTMMATVAGILNTEFKATEVKGDGSKSVLFAASMLAKELKKLKEQKWKILSSVWVEMMSYAANHCTATSHDRRWRTCYFCLATDGSFWDWKSIPR
ncbi:uncharacterized protein LOC131182460 [Hevea brasiliensis]|uniref:uncharacterized protein LOC131182460 n=1 Tax=Hevea brasiliensis TaxID=3981 RepID=UPI0025F407EE|nr:uncharacterized protein LOC131182460 [Hevea brasiliensis]